MNKKDNRRVKMTKQILKDTLLELLETQNLHKISIRKLCDTADINRSTFYKYYGSQYELFHEMEEDLLSMIEGELSRNHDLTNILGFIKAHIKLCKILINENADTDFQSKLLGLPAIINKLKNEMSEYDETEFLYAQKLILFGGYHMIVHWINTDCQESPERMTGIIMTLIRRIL